MKHYKIMCVPVAIVIGVLAGCDGHTTVSGTVTDEKGQAMRDVAVSLTLDGAEVGRRGNSNGDGQFFVGGTHRPTRDPLTLVVQADSYHSEQRELDSGVKHENVQITLRSIDERSQIKQKE
jgi:hypothetical protein